MKLRIAYSGATGGQNAYTTKMSEAFSTFGDVEDVPSIRTFSRAPWRFARKFDVIVFNWIENKIVNKKGAWSGLGVLKLFSQILYGKLLAKRSIFVRHNNFPHAAGGVKGEQMRRFIDLLENAFDDCITHSGHNATAKRHYVPHPLYHPVDITVPPSSEHYFVVFGRIERYKGVHDLIVGYTSEHRLVIAGPCHDAEYRAELEHLRIGRNVDLRIGFISEEDATSLVANSLGLVLSHSGRDMVATGSYFFAAGLGTPVIAIETPFLNWVVNDLGQPGVYIASNTNELMEFAAAAGRVSREMVRGEAHTRFGPEAVRSSLQKILEIKKDQDE
jgi:glycosyltransferase involved in cell wall biosynthesis